MNSNKPRKGKKFIQGCTPSKTAAEFEVYHYQLQVYVLEKWLRAKLSQSIQKKDYQAL